MSDPMGLLNISPMQASKPICFLPPDLTSFSQFLGTTTRSSFTGFRLGDLFVPDSSYVGCSKKSSNGVRGGVSVVRALTNTNFSGGGGSVRELDSSSPVSVELQPILNESQFDRVIAEAQHLEEPVVILWSASWCRKCIYLKPKLEKLAADYHPRIRFYSIDVNNVPLKLVLRAGVTKMPTIQLWKDNAKQAEVIGGHEAYLVVNEVREMIENGDEL